MPLPYLHAAHQVRETFGALQLASWLVIGVGLGTLVLTWGRILAWLRAPEESRAPRLRRWGQDADGHYFELFGGSDWSVEFADGSRRALVRGPSGSLRATASTSRPVALIAADGMRLPL